MNGFLRRFNGAALQRAARRWIWALAGALVGVTTVLGWDADVIERHSQLQQQVQGLQSAARPASAAAVARPAGLDWVDRLPAQSAASRLGLDLQSGLAPHGLQVQALRPQALQAGVPLPSQAVALRWQGRFVDFAQAWSSLVDAGPVWTLDRLTVVPSLPTGQLQWDGVWRAWLRPDAAAEQAWPAGWVTSSRPGLPLGHDPFAPVVSALASPAAAAASDVGGATWPADPRQWPLASVRLVGLWQQAGSVHAVLAAGPHWVVLGAGDRLALEGYRIKAVHAESVELQPLKGGGWVHVLRLERESP